MQAESDVDPRVPRFAAALTTLVIALVLLTGNGWLLAAQAVVFGVGAFAGLRFSPYALLFSRVVRPRLAPVVPPFCAAAPGSAASLEVHAL